MKAAGGVSRLPLFFGDLINLFQVFRSLLRWDYNNQKF